MALRTERQEGRLTAADGTDLAWQSWLPAGKTPVAAVGLIHGGGEHSGRYPDLVACLVDDGIAVHALDLRGHGLSGGRRGHVDRFSDYMGDVERFFALVRSVAGGAPTFVLGYSLGGVIGASYALSAQDELAGVIMIGPALAIGESASKLQFAAARGLSAAAPRLPLFKMKPDQMMSDADAVAAYREDPLVHHGRFDVRLLAELLGAMQGFPDRVHDLELPLLVLHGEADVTADPAGSRIAIECAGSTDKMLKTYPGMRHDILNEPGKEQVCSDIADWIGARSGARTSDHKLARA